MCEAVRGEGSLMGCYFVLSIRQSLCLLNQFPIKDVEKHLAIKKSRCNNFEEHITQIYKNCVMAKKQLSLNHATPNILPFDANPVK